MPVFPSFRKLTHQLTVYIPTGCSMLMNHKIRNATYEFPVHIPALFRVFMNLQRFIAANQPRLLPAGLFDITISGMCMFLPFTGCPLHGNCRKNQRIGGAEYNNTRHGLNNLSPDAFSFILF